MQFVVHQNRYLRSAGHEVKEFYLKSRINPIVLLGEVRRFRLEQDSFRPDIIHANYGTVTALFTSRLAKSPVVVTFRGSDLNPVRGDSSLVNSCRLFLSKMAASSTRTRAIICVSKQLASVVGDISKKIVVIPDGLDLGLFKPADRSERREALGWSPSVPVVLFNASRHPVLKRLDLAKQVLGRVQEVFPHACLHVLNGKTEQEKVVDCMNASDVLLVTSDFEGSPNVVKEAMACNLPVVSVDVGDVAQQLENTSCSIVCDRNVDALANAAIQILSELPRSNGREHVKELDWSILSNKILNVFHGVLLQA